MNIIYSFKKLITYRKSTSVLPSTWTMKLQCNGETENVLSWGTVRKKAVCLDTQIMSEHRLANRKKNREEQLILLSPESDRWIESASSVLVLSTSCINRVSFPLKAHDSKFCNTANSTRKQKLNINYTGQYLFVFVAD